MGLAVGIDLGTTNSVVAWVDGTGQPAVIPNSERRPITPSVICFRDGKVLIGDVAKEMQALGTWPIAAFFKRQMGDPLFLFHAAGKDYTPTDLSALVLAKLKAEAQAQLGQPITHAVITVPAYFRDAERKATIAAGAAAGLTVLQVINEPTAAAIAYGLGRKEAERGTLLVYDLGGGTFDVTLLDLEARSIRVRCSDGDHQLGGKDWDDRIVEYVAAEFRAEFGVDPLADAESVLDLLSVTEDAKKKLSEFTRTTIALTHDGNRGRFELDRAKFEELTRDLMERTALLTRRALDDAQLQARDIDRVLLVGGSTRMPMVRTFIERTFGRPPLHGVDVDEAVALGAAAVAAELIAESGERTTGFALRGPVRTVDVTNHSLGMIAANSDRSAYVNSVILPKNTAIPCQETRPYQHRTRSRGDNRIEVFMTQGDSDSPAEVSYIGKYVIHDIPHGKGLSVVDVEYEYDLSGVVAVSARSRDSKQELRVSVEPLPADLPDRFLVPPEPLTAESPEHLTAYLAFDLSGSMSGGPLESAKKAALGFARNTDLGRCSIGVIAFSDTVKIKLEASQNARAIERAVEGLKAGETGGGNEGDPFDTLHDALKRVRGRRFGIVLADGVWADQPSAVRKAKRCHAADIDVIAIGFGGADREFLRAIASSDETSFFTTMNGLVETFTTIAQVLTETGGGASGSGPQPQARQGFISSVKGALKR